MKLKKITLVVVLAIPTFCFAAERNVDAMKFWQEFRRAVQQDRIEKIASLARFPFEVRGPVDGDPVIRYDRNEFPAIYRKICGQRVGVQWRGNFVEKRMCDVIAEKESLGRGDFLAADIIRVHQFLFIRDKGKWLFYRAYLEN